MLMRGSNPHKVPDQFRMPAQNPVVLSHCVFYALRQALHIRSEQLETLRQSLVSLGQPIKPFFRGHDWYLTSFAFGRIGRTPAP